MKIFKYIIAVISLLLIGCSESIVDSNSSGVNYSTNTQWISIDANSNSKIEAQYTSSKNINQNKGGKVKLNTNSNGLKMSAELEIPESAFSGPDNLLISIILDDQTTSVTFDPTPFTFNKELNFDLEYDGLNLTGVDLSTIEFVYLNNDGSFIPVSYDELITTQNKIKVVNAKISHFSRYGFIKGPEGTD